MSKHTCKYLVTGDAVVCVGCCWVVCAAVQRLWELRALLQVGSVQTAGVLEERRREAHLSEVVRGGNVIPRVRTLVVRREFCQLRFCWRWRCVDSYLSFMLYMKCVMTEVWLHTWLWGQLLTRYKIRPTDCDPRVRRYRAVEFSLTLDEVIRVFVRWPDGGIWLGLLRGFTLLGFWRD